MSGLLNAILPHSVSCVEQRGTANGRLLPGEEQALGHASQGRRREFTAGRQCAREALSCLGVAEQAILRGQSREPVWPKGIVGSITHTEGYYAAAVAHQKQVLTLGIDSEPNEPLPEGILAIVALPTEIKAIDRLPVGRICWDRLLFSIKESVYKAWFPATLRWLDFHEAHVTIRPAEASFQVELLRQSFGTPFGNPLINGRYLVADRLLLSSICIPANHLDGAGVVHENL